jgi:hypothetical protein
VLEEIERARGIAASPRLDRKPVILREHVKDIGGIWNLNNFEMSARCRG